MDRMHDNSGEADPHYIRLMRGDDLPRVIAIDRKVFHQERSGFFAGKFATCLEQPDINTSLAAEVEGITAGFLMGQLFFGEFGIPATRSVLDVLGVHPDYAGLGVGRALLDQYKKNLRALRVERIDTLVDWTRLDLLEFFKQNGFRPSRNLALEWDLNKYRFRGQHTPNLVVSAESGHLEAVAAIEQAVVPTSNAAYFQRKFQLAQTHPRDHFFLVTLADNAVAGFLVGGVLHGEFGIGHKRGFIESFVVAEKFRHQGVASALMEYLLGRLKQQEVWAIETLCRWNDWELLQFFEYVGFRPSFRINLEFRISEEDGSSGMREGGTPDSWRRRDIFRAI